jgi:hypothetical protein
MQTTITHRGKPYIVDHAKSSWGTEVLTVWEFDGMPMSLYVGHSTITTFNRQWFGQVGTRRLPKWIDDIPGLGHPTLDKRIEIVHRRMHREAQIAQIIISRYLAQIGHDSTTWNYNYDWKEATRKAS